MPTAPDSAVPATSVAPAVPATSLTPAVPATSVAPAVPATSLAPAVPATSLTPAVPATVVTCRVNGEPRTALADPRDTLLGFLRERLGLTGTKEGCSNGNCGSCTVLLDGEPVCACLVLAREIDGRSVTTVEGISNANTLHPVQAALIEYGGTQCGFCTPGIVISAVALLARDPRPDADAIRHAIAGNICRCTGYDKIVEAIAVAADAMAQARTEGGST